MFSCVPSLLCVSDGTGTTRNRPGREGLRVETGQPNKQGFFSSGSHLCTIYAHTTSKRSPLNSREGWDSSGTFSESPWSRSHKVV